jgi:hypothetical protein
MKRLLVALATCAVAAACGGTARATVQTWTGTYSLPAKALPVQLSVEVRGARGIVWMGYGHPARTDVSVARRGAKMRFALPGLPNDVVFDGTSRRTMLSERVSQGALRGTFQLRRGASSVLPLFGLYRSSAGATVAVVRATGFRPWLVELPSGRVHGIGAALTVGARLGDTSGAGAITRMADGIMWQGVNYERVPLEQREVRVGVNAATLTVPLGKGPFAAVAMVHGSGPNTREEFQVFAAYCALLGIAVSQTTSAGSASRRAGIQARPRRTPRSTCSRAMRRPRSGPFVRCREWIRIVSACSATARLAGSMRSPERASRAFAGLSHSSGRL